MLIGNGGDQTVMRGNIRSQLRFEIGDLDRNFVQTLRRARLVIVAVADEDAAGQGVQFDDDSGGIGRRRIGGKLRLEHIHARLAEVGDLLLEFRPLLLHRIQLTRELPACVERSAESAIGCIQGQSDRHEYC